jgi:RNA polymerase sigma-70 factor, ECF subfamily
VTAEPGGIAAPPDVSPDEIEPLVRAMSGLLFRIAFRILGNGADAEDAVQNAWIKAMRSWPRVSSLATAEEQCAFMIHIVVKEALQLIRKRYRRRESLGADGKEDPSVLEYVEDYAQIREELRLAWQAIGRLPEGRRAVVVLYTAGYDSRPRRVCVM